jgi:hypothetical protein
MIVHRWGILRKAIPMNISLTKTSALVVALCKLHNFCIDENDIGITKPIADDSLDIALPGGLDLNAFAALPEGRAAGSDSVNDMTYQHETDRINDLLDGGDHMDDVPRSQVRLRGTRAGGAASPLPFQVMLKYVEDQGFQRPLGGRRAR